MLNTTFVTERLKVIPAISKFRAVFAWITMVTLWVFLFIDLVFIDVIYTKENLWRFEHLSLYIDEAKKSYSVGTYKHCHFCIRLDTGCAICRSSYQCLFGN
ncbi:hypothetical protein J2Z48_001049 [Croceifilum oryzae]|uniref:Uncharacterized protein n=1 Tax=Croceifilum oryzae TaxID=1553429 RepID=A0AAJ1WPV3_9BACL|nr:hypothetical protein [Croceifilum oryzae]MDQ0416877.1 hypothetical protein [Croceifilum oryzae]